MKRNFITNGCSITVLAVLCWPAMAQFVSVNDPFHVKWNNPFSASVSTMVMNRAREESLARRLGVNQAQPERANTEAPRRTPDDGSTTFHPTGTYLKTPELADQLGSNPAEREQYLKLMNAAVQEFEKEAIKAGKPNDLALALSFFLGENARIYHGQSEPPPSQFVDLRNMIASALAEGNALRGATDRQKQEMYETLVAYTGLTMFGYEEARRAGNREMASGFRRVAGQNLQAVTHLSPDDITFTATGLNIGSPSR